MGTIQRIERLTYPEVEPVSLEEAKLQLRIDGTDEDSYLPLIISAAREKVETYTQRFICECDAAIYFDTFPDGSAPMQIMLPDVSAVSEITYIDSSETEQTLSYGYYELDSSRREIRAITAWPTDCRSVRVELTAGQDFSASPWPEYPKPLKQAMLIFLTDLFENRGDIVIGTISSRQETAVNLMYPFRLGIGM